MDHQPLSELIKLSHQIPGSTLDRMIRLTEFEEALGGYVRALRREFSSSNAVIQIANVLERQASLSPKEAGLILRTVQLSRQVHEGSDVSLVWSGPTLKNIPMRRTGQVILELLDEAEETLFISSFAVYKITEIMQHLAAAVDRGVAVSMLLETPQSSHYKIKHDPAALFPEELREKITFLIWPYKNRVTGEDDITGSLHAKFILQDQSRLFVSSANLTESAMDRNIELGVLIEDEKVVQRFDEQLKQLISNDLIVKV
jgi:phosphatidylserine/phosphatidylglycerophosphate/cardiolipin synthase-like enzyme